MPAGSASRSASPGTNGSSSSSSRAPLPDSDRLVFPDDRPLVTEFTFFTMQQMMPCNLEASGNGSRSTFDYGFPGLACVHCAGSQGARKFFYRTAEILGGNYAHIPNHLMSCRYCPLDVKATLEEKKKAHAAQKAKLGRGSQRTFFARVWNRLHANCRYERRGGDEKNETAGDCIARRGPEASYRHPSETGAAQDPVEAAPLNTAQAGKSPHYARAVIAHDPKQAAVQDLVGTETAEKEQKILSLKGMETTIPERNSVQIESTGQAQTEARVEGMNEMRTTQDLAMAASVPRPEGVALLPQPEPHVELPIPIVASVQTNADMASGGSLKGDQ